MKAILTAFVLTLIVSCGSDDQSQNDILQADIPGGVPEEMHNEIETMREDSIRKGQLFLFMAQTQRLRHSHYQVWFIEGNNVHAGLRFNLNQNLYVFQVDAQGNHTRYIGRSNQNRTAMVNVPVSKYDKIVVTIEPNGDTDPGPSATKVVAGDVGYLSGVPALVSLLTTGHEAAMGTHFARSSAQFILKTPTYPEGLDENGVWFVNPTSGTPGIQAPVLPTGWAYEGWVVDPNGKKISTGTFQDPAGADSDGAGASAGPESAPPLPGQDFISPALDIRGKVVAVTIEPQPDNDSRPSGMVLFKAQVSEDQATGVGIKTSKDNITNFPVILAVIGF